MELISGLERTKEYVKKGWTQEHEANDIFGNPVSIDDERAAEWCLFGGLKMAYYELEEEPNGGGLIKWIHEATRSFHDAVDDDYDKYFFEGLQRMVWWNDEPLRTQEEVVELLDNTIARCA